ncbi:MAG: N-acetylmuramoyl-L-alanine amidase [Lachnospiraceae bacterium]
MRRMKRFVAGVLCASMLLNMNGITTFAATIDKENYDEGIVEEFLEESTQEESTQEESTQEESTQEESTQENSQQVETSEDDMDTQGNPDSPEVQGFDVETTTITDDSNQDNAAQKDAPLINWLVVAEDYITSSMTQNILIDVGNEETEIADASITYIHSQSGKEYTQSLTKKEGTLLTFQLDGSTIKESGEYVITGLSVEDLENHYVINLSEIGIDAKFGVEVVVDSDPDVYLTSEDNTLDMEGVVVTDAEGNEISSSDIGETISKMAGNQQRKRTSDGVIVVVLDPGHGGSDYGACGNGVYEKNANLKIAQYCKAQLENYKGLRVYMTRESDVYVGLEERVDYAASVGADLFVSLHNNSASSGATGSEVYYPNPNYNPATNTIGAGVSQAIVNALAALGLANRGIRTRDYSPAAGASTTDYYPDGSVSDYYSIIRNSKLRGFTGIIVEHAFISNYSDAVNYLTNDSSLYALGVADANAIASYFGFEAATETTYQGIDYKDVYDYDYYMNRYPQLKKLYENDKFGALKHFVEYGIKEKRQACEDFNVTYYMNRYVGLRNAFGKDYRKYYIHYMRYGKKEGRDGKTYCDRKGAVTQYEGIDYSDVYDFDYYQNKYDSIRDLCGDDDIATLSYFVEYGMNDGDQAIETFNVDSYACKYYDLRKQFKNDLKLYYKHYIDQGKKQGRTATGVTTMQGGITTYNGVDYSAVYNVGYYAKKYTSLNKLYGYDDASYFNHFLKYGMKEGRQASEEFNVTYYKNRYVGLRNVYGSNLKNYYIHYIKAGKKDGLDGKTPCTRKGKVTKYNGKNYSDVYDFDDYLKYNADVKQKVSDDDIAAIEHFVKYGMKEGRQAKTSFNVKSYACKYYDLRKAYKNNLPAYYNHYINRGKKQGRTATGVTTMQGGITVYNGVDYAAVYNVGYYSTKYKQLYKLYGFDDDSYLAHFVKYGMRDGRQASEEFNVTYYMNRYPSLRNVFGTDLKKYYLHYIKYGQSEGRDGATYCERRGCVTVYQGVDYKDVYDFDFYLNKYKALRNTFGDDEWKALEHFVKYGMKEGRQAKESFDVTSYRYANPDLRKLYRGNLVNYFTHYMNYGKNEPRKTTGVTTLQKPWTVYNGVDYSSEYDFWQFREDYPAIAEKFGMDDYGLLEYYVTVFSSLMPIAGKVTTSVDQMIAYYKSRADYPDFYQTSDAPSINKFCQIVYDESVAEGIDPAVVFCQAMKETGFLKFGGDVSITQYNFAGLGATGGGVAGESFPSVRYGIRAQVQHLKAYANALPLNNACVDTRFSYVTRGTAPFVEWLGIHENPYGRGWAAAQNYGYSLKKDYIFILYRY